MKYFSLLILVSGIATTTQAKSWRVNNNPGVVANFTTFLAAAQSTDVKDGDTLYFEPSATSYFTNGHTLNKRLTLIGPGYLLDPNNSTYPGNGGLQALTEEAKISAFDLGVNANGTKIIGLTLATLNLMSTSNITIERCYFSGTLRFYSGTSSGITVRKCIFVSTNVSHLSGTVAENVIIENNIFSSAYLDLGNLTGSSNIIRNNNISSNNTTTVVKAYFVNNIISSTVQCSLTDCTIKNNLFSANQTLPATATGNQVNVVMADVYENMGSYDGKYRLKSTSPAKGAGLSAGTVVNPDCGAFGATDPYVLSGIPNVPSIYSLSAPTSIPSGQATMNITFSTRNNN